ncbi:MAG: DNA double-strand break repair nuclease NurA [Nitrososphaerales archaeon]
MMSNQLNVIPSNKIELENQFSKSLLAGDLGNLTGKRVIFRTDFAKEPLALGSLASQTVTFHSVPQEFSKSSRERRVAAIDSSCVLIGETEQGAIYAGRVATVFSKKGMIQEYCRAGPVIFYLDPSVSDSRLKSMISGKLWRLVLLDRSIAERFIRIHLERIAQVRAAESLSDGIVLLDGSLKSSPLEPVGSTLRDLERVCEASLNQLIGFSKASSLRLISNAASALQSYEKSQVFIDITSSVRALIPSFGKSEVTVAKFCSNSPVFRVDASSANSEDKSQVFSDLKYNDSFFRGYPETLRLAHHLSVFDSSTISSVRSYLSKQYGLVAVPSDDLRATILGRFV